MNGASDLVILCDWLPPDFGAVGQYILQRAAAHAGDGRRVVLYGLTSEQDSVDERSLGRGTLRVVRLHARAYNRAKLRERAWWTLRTNITLVFRALSDIRASRELLITGSPPFMLHLVAPLNVLLRRKLTYRITDFFPEVLIAEMGRASWYMRALAHLTVYWRSRVNQIEVLGECQRQRLLEMGIPTARISVVPPTAPIVVGPETRPLERPAPLEGKKILLYSGNLGVAHDHETFLAGYRKHHREGSGRVTLWLNATGARADLLEHALRAEGLPVHRTAPVPLDRLASLLATCDAHLVTLRDAFVGYVLPSKIYACIDSGRPILYVGSPQSDVHRLGETKSTPGWYVQVSTGDAQGVFAVLERLSNV